LKSSATQYYFGLLRQVVKLQLLFLLVLSLFRLFFLLQFSPPQATFSGAELADAFVLGFRVDLVLVSYLTALPLLLILLNHLFGNRLPLRWLPRIFAGYFIAVYLLVSIIVGIDFGYYSFFGEHIKLLIFGFFDDDTAALLKIGWKNYNVPLILALFALYAAAVVWTVRKVLADVRPLIAVWRPRWTPPLYLLLVALLVVGARGSVGLFPLIKDIPDVSADAFVNSLPKNGVFALEKAFKQYRKDKSGRYDLIGRAGYRGSVPQAFRDYLGTDEINTGDLIGNLARVTPANPAVEARPPNVVVVMVESFGSPILKYQSDRFDIMRRLKKHFDEDIVFTNFLSGSNGTIVSLEPLLLNVVARPKSISYGQSRYLGVSFPQAAAEVYRKAGYETHFVYGGDLSWRNVGSFFKRQGFEHVEGKSAIEAALPGVEEHDWGVYDKHAYDFVLKKLHAAKKPQFIFLLTTNNHPPYILSKHYDPKPLHFSEALKKHLTGDLDLDRQRFQDYQYALDMAGRFMDKVKGSGLITDTVVAITADNNTVEGIMHYDNTLQESKQIPFYLYLPPYLRREPFDRNVSASHNDIFPTLYDKTLSGVRYVAIGQDLFKRDTRHCGYNDDGIIVSSGGAFRVGSAANPAQKACEKQYKAALAVTEVIVKTAAKETAQ
jgi:phosphoglycerol transferase MdoB-like AlkP superfamily enzyme